MDAFSFRVPGCPCRGGGGTLRIECCAAGGIGAKVFTLAERVWALRAFGFRCVIGVSPAEFFRDNCLKNGLLPITLNAAQMAELAVQVRAADGHAPFTVDLEACEIRGPGGYECRFDIAPFERAALLEGLDDIGQTRKHLAEIEAWEARTLRDKPFLQASIAQVAAPKA